MNPLYSELQWLPRPPADFSAQLKSFGTGPGPLGRELQALTTFGLDLNQLTKVAKAMARVQAEGKALEGLIPFKLAVLANSTIDLVVPALVASAARHGIALEVIQPSYDQVAQEALTPDSKVNKSKPHAVLFALDYRALPLKLSLGDADAASASMQGALGYLQALRNGIKAVNPDAICIFQSFAPPVEEEHLFRVVDALQAVAAETEKSVPQVALNWLLQRPTVATLVIGARNEDQLRANLGATGWKLTPEQVAKLDAASASPPAYPYWHQRFFTERNPPPV